jgi:CBS domain-containing protein
MLVVILHETEYLPNLLEAWRNINIPGVTILQSMGGFQAETMASRGGLGGFLNLFEGNRPQQRTIFSLIDDGELLARAIAEADRVVKGFDRPHSGILFTIPLGEALGLKKWGQPARAEELDLLAPKSKEERGVENLVKWLEEDIKEKKGKKAIVKSNMQRSTLVSEIVKVLDLKPAVVQVDTPLSAVVEHMLDNPKVPLACVVNTENRLMGVIPTSDLADYLMVTVAPGVYVETAEDYEKARKFINEEEERLASDLMRDPFFTYLDDTLEKAYHIMRLHRLTGIPVVDQHYHVQGFVNLLAVMAICKQSE